MTESLDRSLSLLRSLSTLLLLVPADGSASYPDEFDTLLRFCIWARPRHFCRVPFCDLSLLLRGPIFNLVILHFYLYKRVTIAPHILYILTGNATSFE